MAKRTPLMLLLPLLALTACGRDWYGDMFVTRKPVTFCVQSDSGTPLNDVEVKCEELDAFDYDLIVDGTHYAHTDADGLVTVTAVFNDAPGYSSLGERTTRFTFTAADHTVFDTIFNYWNDTVNIILYRG